MMDVCKINREILTMRIREVRDYGCAWSILRLPVEIVAVYPAADGVELAGHRDRRRRTHGHARYAISAAHAVCEARDTFSEEFAIRGARDGGDGIFRLNRPSPGIIEGNERGAVLICRPTGPYHFIGALRVVGECLGHGKAQQACCKSCCDSRV